MADSFYFGNDMQDLLLACMLTYRSEFHVLGSLVQPEFMWGASATRIMHGIQDYHTKEGLFPGFTALDGFLLEQFSRDKADIYKDCHDYLEDLKELDTTDWKWVKSVTIKFCRERSLIVAIKKAADLVKTDKIPDGGFTKMFDEAMAVGGVLEPSRTLSQVAQQPSDPNNNVLGDRYGFQGGSLLLVGATGIGKSALSYQLAI